MRDPKFVLGYGVPRESVLPTSTIKFLGSNFTCPRNSETYLRALYGDFEEVEYTYLDAAAVETRRQFNVVDKARMQHDLTNDAH